MATVKLNLKGFRELRTAPKVRAYVQAKAEEIARDGGPFVEARETESPRNRARSAIVGQSRDQERMLRALGSHVGRS